ncbi:GntP family permease [Tepidanaerobacter acetatoxydans]|uniref:GntP family permease n=1 Tax=Tepidanaerobacter acetatoxydans TaxID=499229 RepID=UPI001BD5D2F9|nr:SLC13 family permease [Tepidanaerobacter acetatoxydans]
MSLSMILLNMAIALVIIMVLIIKLNINATISLFIGGLYMGIVTNMGLTETVDIFTKGFGGIMGSMGLSIGFGVIMGQLLSDAGGAYVIAKKMVSFFPKEKAVIALILTSFIISIPVFFDVTLIIMIPIAFAVAKEIGAPRSLIACALVAGAGSAHSYVPPTPAPLAAAEILNLSLGSMIIVGSIISLIAIVAVYPIMKHILWPKDGQSKFFTDKDMDPDFIPIQSGNYVDKTLPSFSVALLPIFLPVILILIGSTWHAVSDSVPPIISFIGDKNIALMIGALISYTIARENMTKSEISRSVNKALETSGVVLLITGAGGAFGSVIKSTGIGDMITALVGTSSSAVVPVILITYFIGVIFRVCMGSASSAGITTLTIMSPVIASIATVHPVWFAMAGLAGCNMIGLVNDSGFWVSTNLNGFTVTGGLKTYTVFGAIRSLVILLLILIASQLFPLV